MCSVAMWSTFVTASSFFCWHRGLVNDDLAALMAVKPLAHHAVSVSPLFYFPSAEVIPGRCSITLFFCRERTDGSLLSVVAEVKVENADSSAAVGCAGGEANELEVGTLGTDGGGVCVLGSWLRKVQLVAAAKEQDAPVFLVIGHVGVGAAERDAPAVFQVADHVAQVHDYGLADEYEVGQRATCVVPPDDVGCPGLYRGDGSLARSRSEVQRQRAVGDAAVAASKRTSTAARCQLLLV